MKKYLINEKQVSKDVFESELETAITEFVEENYDELLDDCNDPYKIGTLTFYPSQILSECDPIAYRCGISDEISNQIEEAEYELDHYGIYEFDTFTFEITEEDEDDEDDEDDYEDDEDDEDDDKE